MGRADRAERLISAFKDCSGPFPWRDFEKILTWLGYEPVKLSGRTRGSKRRFAHPHTKHIIMLDEPHDGTMGPGMVRRLRKELEDRGVI
jgi:predicted RNA binding protein YcfA (HicA-like mRNA interferase family)